VVLEFEISEFSETRSDVSDAGEEVTAVFDSIFLEAQLQSAMPQLPTRSIINPLGILHRIQTKVLTTQNEACSNRLFMFIATTRAGIIT
jgi:hypothetical protein